MRARDGRRALRRRLSRAPRARATARPLTALSHALARPAQGSRWTTGAAAADFDLDDDEDDDDDEEEDDEEEDDPDEPRSRARSGASVSGRPPTGRRPSQAARALQADEAMGLHGQLRSSSYLRALARRARALRASSKPSRPPPRVHARATRPRHRARRRVADAALLAARRASSRRGRVRGAGAGRRPSPTACVI